MQVDSFVNQCRSVAEVDAAVQFEGGLTALRAWPYLL